MPDWQRPRRGTSGRWVAGHDAANFSRGLTHQGDANPTHPVYRLFISVDPFEDAFREKTELAIMIGRANQFIARPSIGWWAKQARSVARALWAKLRDALDAYRQWRAAETVYTELSRLSDAELERRGIARGDLGRLVSEMDQRR